MSNCDLPRPDPQALYQRITDLFSANVLGGAPVIPESNEWYVVNNDYAAHELFYSVAGAMFREQDVETACCDNLIKLAANMGLYPRPATFARGYVKITGVANTPLPTSLEFQFGGKEYISDPLATMPANLGPDGFAIVQVQAVQPGSEGNTPINTGNAVGSVTTPVVGLNTQVEVLGQFCNGGEAEGCEEFRQRVLYRRKYGGRADYRWLVEKLKEWPCLTRVCFRDCGCCFQGKIEVYVFFDNTFPHGIPPAHVANDVQRWMFGTPNGAGKGQAPIGMFGQIYLPTTTPVSIEIINMSCVSRSQIEIIKSRFREYFANLCPGQRVCRKHLDAIIVGVEPSACEYSMSLRVDNTAIDINCFDTIGDIIPDCDVLPVLVDLKIT